MKKVGLLLCAFLLSGGVASGVLAAEESPHREPLGSAPVPLQTSVGTEATERGTIGKIDPSTGKIEVKTARGTAEIYREPDFATHFKVGEEVTLELEQAQGTISKLNAETGMLIVKSGKNTSKLYFAPEAVKNFKEGAPVVVDVESVQK
jgi:hypothetical protein